jgi:uncharacterized protein (DUF3820 family)
MSTFRIAWKSFLSGKRGFGTREFSEAEAMLLCQELNAKHPDIEHVPVTGDQVPVFKNDPPPHKPAVLPLTDTDPMPFGSHEGTRMARVPSSYLDWLSGQAWLAEKFPQVADYIQRNRKGIDEDLRREERE